MQNYLQKPKKKIPVARVIAAILAFSAAIVSIVTFLRDNGILTPSRFASESPQTSFAETSDVYCFNTQNKSMNAIAEMNNPLRNNAKNVYSNTNTSQKGIKCDKVRVLQDNNTVTEMPLEEYVTACVLGEMPLYFEAQAIMAQSVAARTFAVRQALGKSKHKNADVCTNPACCQNFVLPESAGVTAQNLDKLKSAVNATRGIIIVYDGEPIEAVYHASSGEGTLDSEDVWGGRVEYLRSVKSPEGEIEVSSSGMGHRVGMSQYGANIFACDGMSYIDILKYYYNGVSLDFLC